MSSTNENTPNEQLFNPEHASELLQKLQLLQSDGENGLSDVVLIAGKNGQRVPAHRVILAARSPYFAALFSAGMSDSTASEVTLDDVHGHYLLHLVIFCYTRKIKICADTVDELVQTASRLQFNGVVSVCSQFMERHLDASNCLGVAALAEHLSLSKLKQSADKYVCKNFVQVSEQEEFLQVNIDQLKVLLASDCLNVRTEEVVLHSVMSWLRYEMKEEDKRYKHTAALLALLRLSYLPITFLTEHGMIWNLCHEHACLPLLAKAFGEANEPIRSRHIKPRKSMQPSLLAVFHSSYKKPLGIAEYSYIEDKWEVLDKTLSYRFSYAVAFLNNELVYVGGTDSSLKLSNIVETLNLDTMTLSKLPSMAQDRDEHSIAVLDGLLYAVGGSFKCSTQLNSVERYDPNDSKWSYVASMSVARCWFGLAVLNGRLFAVGGYNGSTFLNSTECYNPEIDKWTPLANLNISRAAFGIASGNGFLYAVGGDSHNRVELRSIERYDPQADKWTEICSLESPRAEVSCVFLDDRLLVLNMDKTYRHRFPSFEEYNLENETGEELTTDGLMCLSITHLRTILK